MNKPTARELNKIDLREKINLLNSHTDRKYFDLPAGREHYRLLHWLSTKHQFILELGTFRGLSALAMFNQNHIHTYDVEDHDKSVWLYKVPEISCILYDGNIEPIPFEKYSMIFLDTMHDGKFEQDVIDHLTTINWKGILIADDIRLHEQMKEWWNNIQLKKEDWTDIGHWSGSGIIYFE